MINVATPVVFIAMATAAVLVSLVASAAIGRARDAGVAGRPLAEILEKLERDGYGPFCEVAKREGCWEVGVRRDGVLWELTVDPHTGMVLSEHREENRLAPTGALPLSRLLKSLQHDQEEVRVIDEISFDHRYWGIEYSLEGRKREIRVDPLTAEVVADGIGNR